MGAYYLDRFFGVHCNECKEVITDRVMKAGDKVRVELLQDNSQALIIYHAGLPRGLLQVQRVHGQTRAR